ncbi:MAG: DUF4382 domain-containing protein [Chloroflexaceae bacterium]|nr:DUF4382 domain-containing protein [Chloroflexaceae bacterium]
MTKLLLLASLTLIVPGVLIGCSQQETSQEPVSDPASQTSGETALDTTAETTEQPSGTLVLVANGEDFIREGFTTKDGWRIDFENAFVTLDEVNAYQTEPPFDPDGAATLNATQEIPLLQQPTTVDLAKGAAETAPVPVTRKQAPQGTYNAIAWKVIPAETGPAEGSTILLKGTAQKEGRNVDFTISFDQPLAYTCGEYVGDERKGILTSTEQAELETTLHFDHIFGDAETAAGDALNQDAVGFDPFAALAEGDSLNVDSNRLKAELSAQDYQKLLKAIAGLGHVGEGHCRLEN